MKTKCQAKNPETCAYHGTPEHHQKIYDKVQKKYYSLLRSSLTGEVNSYEIAKVKENLNAALASVEAHDEAFEALKQELALEEANSDGTPEYYGEKKQAIDDIKKRIVRAEEVRSKRGTAEESTKPVITKAYVTHLPVGATISSGEKVLAVRRRLGLPSNKREVVLEHRDGSKSFHIWGAYTNVYYIAPQED